MKEFSVYDATRACDGIYNGGEAVKGQMVKGVVIDNRKVEDGFLFVPIKGERFDGHDFIGAAYEAGAVCCLSEKKLETQKPYILVKDSLQAYQDIAEFYNCLLYTSDDSGICQPAWQGKRFDSKYVQHIRTHRAA